MTQAELQRALAEHRIPPLLCLYGAEGYLVERTWRRILDLVVPADARDFNFQQFAGRETRAVTLLDAVQTLPVFSPRRLVLVKAVEDLPATEQEALLPYLKNPLPETVLLLVGEKIDTRRKLFLELRKAGVLVEFKRLYENQIPAFIQDWLRDAGRAMTEDAIVLFCRRVGNSLQEIVGELEKLFSYLGQGRQLADVADVAAVVSDSRVDSVFELTNALGAGAAGEALRLNHRLLAEGEAPLMILSMIVRHFRQLWITWELLEQGAGPQDIARGVGVNPYFVDGLCRQARRFSPDRFRQAFELFLGTDLALKSSGAHPSALLERLVLELAGPDVKARPQRSAAEKVARER